METKFKVLVYVTSPDSFSSCNLAHSVDCVDYKEAKRVAESFTRHGSMIGGRSVSSVLVQEFSYAIAIEPGQEPYTFCKCIRQECFMVD